MFALEGVVHPNWHQTELHLDRLETAGGTG